MRTRDPHWRAEILDRLGEHLLHEAYPMLTWTLLAESTRDVWRARAAAILDLIGCDGTIHQRSPAPDIAPAER